MKKLLTLLTAITFTAIAASATEPLLLDPINPAILDDIPAAVKANIEGIEELEVSVPGQAGFQAKYIKDSNMIPQNAAAEGKPVPKKRLPRIRIETKQGRQTNTQWNPGGKGTKSFF